MELKENIRRRARRLSRNVRNVVLENLHAQRKEGRRYARERAEERREREEAERDFQLIFEEAIKGAKNLVAVCRDQAMQEAAELYQSVNHKELILFQRQTFRREGYILYSSSCQVYMKHADLYLWLDQGLDSNHDDREYVVRLTDPIRSTPEREEESTLEEELYQLVGLYRPLEDRWLVEAVLSIDVLQLEEDEGSEDLPSAGHSDKIYMAWLAFLVACADEKKLAKLVDKAFKKLEV